MKTSLKFNKGSIAPLIIAIVVLVVAVGIYFGTFKSQSLNCCHGEQYATSTENSAWKTYTNIGYGFTFQYPANWKIDTTQLQGGYYDFKTTELVVLSTTPPYIDHASFVLSIVNGVTTNCYIDPGLDKPITKTRTINGNTFHVLYDKAGDAAMGGERGSISEYRIIHNDVCYIVTSNVSYHLVGYAGVINTGKSDATPEEVQGQAAAISINSALLDSVLASLKFTSSTNDTNPIPVITSVTPLRASVGDTVVVKGSNLAGFEGDRNLWIRSAGGIEGVIYGDQKSTGTAINFKLADKYCTQDLSYKGGSCQSFLHVTPGNYQIYAMPWGTKSNTVNFTVTASKVATTGILQGKATIATVCPNFTSKIEGFGISIYKGQQKIKSLNFSSDGSYKTDLDIGSYTIYEENHEPDVNVSGSVWYSNLPKQINILAGSIQNLDINITFSCSQNSQ